MDSDTNALNNVGAARLAAWTLRLSTDPLGYVLLEDPHFFALMYASCASAVTPPTDSAFAPNDIGAATVNNKELLEIIHTLKSQVGEIATGRFAILYLQGMELHQKQGTGTFKKELEAWRDEAEQQAIDYTTSQEQNLGYLGELLNLSDAEQKILSFQLFRNSPGFSRLFDSLLQDHTSGLKEILYARLLDISTADTLNGLSREGVLAQSGLLRIHERPLHIEELSDYLRATLQERSASKDEFLARFVKPLTSTPSVASLARLEEHDEKILLALLQEPLNEHVQNVNALLYGPRRINKEDLLARLFDSEGFQAFIVNSNKVPTSDLPFWVFVAQQYVQDVKDDFQETWKTLKNIQSDGEIGSIVNDLADTMLTGLMADAANAKNNKVLVIDRTDQVLASRKVSMMTLFGFAEEASMDEEEDRVSDEGLSGSNVRCVWLADSADFLTERNLGRFLFHAEVKPGSRADRKQRITDIVQEHNLSPELETDLSRYSLLGDQQVRTAAQLSSMIATTPKEREQVIRRAVHQSQRVLSREATENLRESVTHYSLDNLNVAGNFLPQQIIQALQKRPQGTLCFYGLPGSGKTQLAEFMAVELDKPILMKRASDILSKWLGDSEKNINDMFKEAKEEGAILFLDESDSFLRDRSLAREAYHVSQTNELLQNMERFDGIFIAATNLMRDIDAAALRRFTFKLEFLPLKAEQAWDMFVVEAEFDPAKHDEEQLRDQLKNINNLAPGDFATVKRQCLILGQTLSPEEWVDQLAEEAKAKMLGLERNKVGFGA